MSKCLVLFVEGDTEVEFYKRVIANAKGKRENNSEEDVPHLYRWGTSSSELYKALGVTNE